MLKAHNVFNLTIDTLLIFSANPPYYSEKLSWWTSEMISSLTHIANSNKYRFLAVGKGKFVMYFDLITYEVTYG